MNGCNRPDRSKDMGVWHKQEERRRISLGGELSEEELFGKGCEWGYGESGFRFIMSSAILFQ